MSGEAERVLPAPDPRHSSISDGAQLQGRSRCSETGKGVCERRTGPASSQLALLGVPVPEHSCHTGKREEAHGPSPETLQNHASQ